MLEHGHNQTPNTLTSSPVVSHAKIFPTLEKERDYKGSEADSFLKSAALLATWDQESLFWRTSQLCLLGGWMKFSGRWPRSGTMRNGIAYRLRLLVPRMSGTGFSFWATPTTMDSMAPKTDKAIEKERTVTRKGRTNFANLRDQVVRGKEMFPNPTMWPTPTSRDYKSGKGKTQAERGRSAGPSLAEASGGLLNPQWVEWLMGFPSGWTELEDSATQSCHKSQNTSDAAS